MSAFFRHAEEILHIATAAETGMSDTTIVIDRQGGIRILRAEGWSPDGLSAEFGAEAIYKLERRGTAVRVEGWNGSDRCLLQGSGGQDRLRNLLGDCYSGQATRSNCGALALADSKERVRNS